MSYKFSFADNEVYSADDLNAITKRLVTAGVEDSFSDGVAYNVSRFNEAGKLLYTSGVVPQTCLTLKVQSAGENKILINPGVAFFNDGSTIEIEAGGETLSYVSGVKNYVYLKNDLLNSNVSYPACTEEAPTGDYVLLAEIDEEGNILDKRTYAKGKLPGYQSVGENMMMLEEKMTVTVSNNTTFAEGQASFDIGSNNFEHILTFTIEENNHSCIGIYDIKNEKYFSGSKILTLSSGSVFTDRVIVNETWPEYTSLRYSLIDGVLTVNAWHNCSYGNLGSKGDTREIDLCLILF